MRTTVRENVGCPGTLFQPYCRRTGVIEKFVHFPTSVDEADDYFDKHGVKDLALFLFHKYFYYETIRPLMKERDRAINGTMGAGIRNFWR